MNISAPFIARPVATTLLAVAMVVAGLFAFPRLPVAPIPSVDFPTIQVQAQEPGASPDIIASTVAEPLELHLAAIADVTEITSQNTLGQSRITIQFALSRDINGAARDVEAAIQAARADLPSTLRSNPSYHKFNPAGSPVMVLALTSATRTPAQLYDSAQNVIAQKLQQVRGVGFADIGGSALPAVRVELNPQALFKFGIGLETLRAALASANADTPKGVIDAPEGRYQLYTNDIASHASDYRKLIIGWINQSPVKLSDVAEVVDSTEDLKEGGFLNTKPAVVMIIFPSPGANIVKTIDSIKATLPLLRASLPADETLTIAADRSIAIRASLADTERTLVIAVILVTLVTYLFLRNLRATIIPSVVVPASIIATFGPMYLLHFSLDNLSLMALTVATGFVVDDAIVVLENISRHMEDGMGRREAAVLGAGEVGFTVLSITVSLIAVFTPILLLGGIVGRLFREFAVTLSITIVISMVLALTLTPMMCALFLETPRHATDAGHRPNVLLRASERVLDGMLRGYERSLRWSLRHGILLMLSLVGAVVLTGYLAKIVPKGFFPNQDTGLMIGSMQGDQSVSFQNMEGKLRQVQGIITRDPAVASVIGFTGGRGTNQAQMFVQLKPLAQRVPITQVIARLRPRLSHIVGARAFLFGAEDVRAGGRQSNAAYQYTLQADDSRLLYTWTPRLVAALQKRRELTDVNSDQQQGGLETEVVIDRNTAGRLGVTPAAIDDTLYDAYGQRLVSTIYTPLAQYHVVLEVAPRYWQNTDSLSQIYVSSAPVTVPGTASSETIATGVRTRAGTNTDAKNNVGENVVASATVPGATGPGATGPGADADQAAEAAVAINGLAASGNASASAASSVATVAQTMVPLKAMTSIRTGFTPITVNHQGEFVASTVSFNLPAGESLGVAARVIGEEQVAIGLPSTIRGGFAGTALQFQQQMGNEPILIFAALAAIYVTLGVLYESFIHPLTILSTLPSAGVGALLALFITGNELDVIGFIGIILLIGIVKKNAILLVDFALVAEREHGMAPLDAITAACLLRFRPIMMTSFAAAFGALPLAFGSGEGATLREPLGISIVGGLIVSQALTLYTTPVVYLALDRLRHRVVRRRPRPIGPAAARLT